jgi:ribosomal protein S18 acetylase RimI-like enzyme
MDMICLHDKDKIEAFARRDPFRHLYEIGDLDDFFWEHTAWYALRDRAGSIEQLVLVYTDEALPTLLALSERPAGSMRDLLQRLIPVLPRRFYAHLSQEALSALEDDYRIEPHGLHHKMGLVDHSRAGTFDTSEAVALSAADTEEVSTLYRVSYPGHWFVARMLKTGLYRGIRRGGRLVSVSGVHVYSPRFRVAALGNIATHPDWRGHGFATLVSASLCQALRQAGVSRIGLNVRADNEAAIRCYKTLGFEWAADYGEYTLTRKAMQ